MLERHFHDLQKKYGAVVAVDLVNTVSDELLDFGLTLDCLLIYQTKYFLEKLPTFMAAAPV